MSDIQSINEQKRIHLKEEQKSSDEILEIIKISYQEYEYKHKLFWELLFKSIFSILMLMIIPYILKKDNIITNFYFIFPAISSVLSIFSMIIMKCESVRMSATNSRKNMLLKYLSESYEEIRIREFTNFELIKKIYNIPIINIIYIFYSILFICGIGELVLILTQNFN